MEYLSFVVEDVSVRRGAIRIQQVGELQKHRAPYIAHVEYREERQGMRYIGIEKKNSEKVFLICNSLSGFDS